MDTSYSGQLDTYYTYYHDSVFMKPLLQQASPATISVFKGIFMLGESRGDAMMMMLCMHLSGVVFFCVR